MPARAPASIDMLQTVMRSSMDMARIVEPAYSTACPTPPPAPILAMIARITSLALRVAADQCDARKRQPLLRPDDVHDPSPRVADAEVDDSLVAGVLAERLDHAADLGVRRRRARRGQDVVVRRREREIRPPHRSPALRQPPEGAGRAFVQQMVVYIEEDVPARSLRHPVARPDLFEHGALSTHAFRQLRVTPWACT